MATVPLRRRRPEIVKPTTSSENDTPVTIVFRSHTDSTAKVPFLYHPKNFGLPMPSGDGCFSEAIIELSVPDVDNTNTGTDGHKNNSAVAVPPSASGQGAFSAATLDNAVSFTSTLSSLPVVPSSRVDSGLLRSNASFLLETASTGGATTCGKGSGRTESQCLPQDGAAAAHSGRYETWVCRAYCFGDKDAMHSNGAISVHQSLANRSKFINDITNGKAIGRLLPSYDVVRKRYGLSHVELSFENQKVSRPDMFLVSEALRDSILYEGQEINLLGFTFKVNELLQKTCSGTDMSASVEKNSSSRGTIFSQSSNLCSPGPGSCRLRTTCELAQAPMGNKCEGVSSGGLSSVRCGLVTGETLINFLSLSPLHYIVLEISAQMWKTTSDGCILLDWSVKNFIGEYLTQQIAKYKASPRLRVVMVGRLCPQYAVRNCVDILHVIQVPSDHRGTSVAKEITFQLEEFLRRVLCEVKETLRRACGITSLGVSLPTPAAGVDGGVASPLNGAHAVKTEGSVPSITVDDINKLTVGDIFVHAKKSCTMETICLLVDESEEFVVERNTGVLITVVSAGKGVFQITYDVLQAICNRLLRIGMEKVNVICMGRPPLHVTPLLEYVCEEDNSNSPDYVNDRHPSHCVYEKPEWLQCFFYHPRPGSAAGNLLAPELFTKEEWTLRQERENKRRCEAGDSVHLISGVELPPPLHQEALLLPAVDFQHIAPPSAFDTMERPCQLGPAATSPALSRKVTNDGERLSVSYSCSSDLLSNTVTTPSPLPDAAKGCSSCSWKVPNGALGSSGLVTDTAFCGRAGPHGRQKSSASNQSGQLPFACARWYKLESGVVGKDTRQVQGNIFEVFLRSKGKQSWRNRTGYLLSSLESCGIFVCGKNVLDSNIQSGSMILRLDINGKAIPGAMWDPCLVREESGWAKLMNCFTGKKDPAAPDECGYFESKFCAEKIFSRELSVIVDGGQILLLATRRNNVSFKISETVVFMFSKALFLYQSIAVPDLSTSQPMAESLVTDRQRVEEHTVVSRQSNPSSVTVAHIQLKTNILFTVKPTNPYCTTDLSSEAPSTAQGVSTMTILRRRWEFSHPELPSSCRSDGGVVSAQRSPWSALCYCRILPLFGVKAVYPRDSFFDKPTHQYSVPNRDGVHFLEHVLHRLSKQYQIVVPRAPIAEMGWPREDPAPHSQLVMSIGYQVHDMKIDETGQTLHITRLMHRGMYTNFCNTRVKHGFLLLNYLEGGLSTREVCMNTQIGEEEAFPWDALDSNINDRQRLGAFLPHYPPPLSSANEVCVALLPETPVSLCAAFSDFVNVLEGSLSGNLHSSVSISWSENDEYPSVVAAGEEFQSVAPPLECVVCFDAKQHALRGRCIIDRKTGKTQLLEGPPSDCRMSMDFTAPSTYNRKCHYVVKVSWFVCMQHLVMDWIGALTANALRHHVRCVLVPPYRKTHRKDHLTVRFTVREQNQERAAILRCHLLTTLISDAYRYLPDSPAIGSDCRLLHASGLCYVTSRPHRGVVARWYENPMVRKGQPEHKQLLEEFLMALKESRACLRDLA
uniref:Vacuolar membrane-associated protein Iml1 N-terminal domain-containing protein n=1 Tax=Trypanosoma congolense (strain IL3000) TaxID=1068625 RepID=G0UR27_TRYCI|nr:conserved hypothetical protein [Trypanosoma congolense IL3000]